MSSRIPGGMRIHTYVLDLQSILYKKVIKYYLYWKRIYVQQSSTDVK
jgi:hypothetical protein